MCALVRSQLLKYRCIVGLFDNAFLYQQLLGLTRRCCLWLRLALIMADILDVGQTTTPTPEIGCSPTPEIGCSPTPEIACSPTPEIGCSPTPEIGCSPTSVLEAPIAVDNSPSGNESINKNVNSSLVPAIDTTTNSKENNNGKMIVRR